MHDSHPFHETLASLAHPKGGWGYVPGQAAHLEPTCLALLALSLDRAKFEDHVQAGLGFLERCATADGAYRLDAGREEATWPTALVLIVQTELGLPTQQTAARLLGLQGRAVAETDAVEMHDFDVTLVGWPWAEGTFSWVEPTARAVIALRKAGFGQHQRVQEGQRLLLNRAFPDGGINYGNRKVFGRPTEPVPGPTALMLLALQGQEHPVITSSVAYLQQQLDGCEDLEHLCWGKLALSARRDPGNLQSVDDAIVRSAQARQESSWLKSSPMRLALTALALATEKHHPFAVGDSPAEAAKVKPVSRSFKRGWRDKLRGVFKGVMAQTAANLRELPEKAAVHIARVADYNADLSDVLQRQYESFRDKVPLAGKRVVLKPNLVEYHRDKVINTHPHVVAAAIELCKKEGAAEVIVAEGPGHWRNVEYLVQASGLADVLRHHQVGFVDLNHDDPVKLANMGMATKLEYLYLAQTVAHAEVLISLPKLKTHHWAGATLSLKNMFGTMPGIFYGWPKNELHWQGIDRSIVDIAMTRTPDLAIVDGIIGMEGDGPLNGTPKQLGILVMGADPLAVDATCCRLMHLTPHKVGYLVLGGMKRLGRLKEAEIEQIGEGIASIAQPFETIPQFQHLHAEHSTQAVPGK